MKNQFKTILPIVSILGFGIGLPVIATSCYDNSIIDSKNTINNNALLSIDKTIEIIMKQWSNEAEKEKTKEKIKNDINPLINYLISDVQFDYHYEENNEYKKFTVSLFLKEKIIVNKDNLYFYLSSDSTTLSSKSLYQTGVYIIYK